ncbi:hypothetical protein D1007_29198 [Hordeum vulgare]|nr:hypothetical protein D1007_29198 [Hordeum vulgare]
MGLWNYGREAGSSSGRRRGSVKEEAASPSRRASAPAPFTIGPRYAGATGRRGRRSRGATCTSRTTGISPSTGSRSRRCRQAAVRATTRSSAAAASSPTTSTTTTGTPPIPCSGTHGSGDEHDVRRALYFADTVSGTWRPRRKVRGRTRVLGLTPTLLPSPSPSPPPPPRMTAQEEARLMQRVMEDSMITHDERQWPGLEDAMALSAVGDIAIPELMEAEEVMEDAPVATFHPDLVGQQWSWSCTAPAMAHVVGGRELVPHAAAVTGAGCLATGGRAAGTCQLPSRPCAPRTTGPPLDATGLRRPRQRRRRHWRPLKTVTATSSTGVF